MRKTKGLHSIAFIKARAQSAIEMLSVYSWAIILIAMVVALVFAMTGPFSPAQYLGSSCNIEPLMLCQHTYLAPAINSGEPIKFTLIFTNNLGVTLNFTKDPFNVTTLNVGQSGVLNSTGSCGPQIAHPGTEVICYADIYGPVEPKMYSSVSDTFKVSYYTCSGKSCSGPYTSTGTSIQEISPGAAKLINLSLYAQPSIARIVIDGISYSNEVTVPLEQGNYTIYAITPNGYQFNEWILESPNSSIANANAIQTQISLKSPSALTANFISS
ncbi:MAG: hypothetical protein M1544_02730 [Candidatus Marsarchaeota archaeon]|nr:hypothetical protein [Candidatus Marsarchaeota archaeon]